MRQHDAHDDEPLLRISFAAQQAGLGIKRFADLCERGVIPLQLTPGARGTAYVPSHAFFRWLRAGGARNITSGIQ